MALNHDPKVPTNHLLKDLDLDHFDHLHLGPKIPCFDFLLALLLPPFQHWTLKVKKGSLEDERLGTYRITHEKKGTWLEPNLQGMKCSSRPSSSGVYWNTINRLVNAALTNSKQLSWLNHPPERGCKTTPGNVFEIINLNFKAILGSGFPYGLAVSPQCFGSTVTTRQPLVSWWH